MEGEAQCRCLTLLAGRKVKPVIFGCHQIRTVLYLVLSWGSSEISFKESIIGLKSLKTTNLVLTPSIYKEIYAQRG